MTQFKLVFSGDILPGHETETVKEQLANMLKVPPHRRERLFSGSPLVIKRGLDEATAQAYRRKLTSMGIGIRVAADVPDALEEPAKEQTDDNPPAAALALTPVESPATPENTTANEPAGLAAQAEETMQCPSCGHSQPRRTLCQSCGVDMPRMIAAQQEAAHAATRDIPDAPRGVAVGPYAGDHEPAESESPPYLGFSFKGRLSRRGYIVGTSLLSVVATIGLLIAGSVGNLALILVVFALCYIVGLRLSVLRVHDFNWGGWWTLLFFVPLVNVVFGLFTLFFPGTAGENRFGPQHESPGWGKTLGAMLGSIVCSMVLVALAPQAFMQSGMAMARIMNPQMADFDPSNPASLAILGDSPSQPYDATHDRINIFTASQCPPCALTKMKLDAHGIRYTEFVLDRDPEAQARLMRMLKEIEHQGNVQFPVVQVNGYVLTENPSLAELSEYFGE